MHFSRLSFFNDIKSTHCMSACTPVKLLLECFETQAFILEKVIQSNTCEIGH